MRALLYLSGFSYFYSPPRIRHFNDANIQKNLFFAKFQFSHFVQIELLLGEALFDRISFLIIPLSVSSHSVPSKLSQTRPSQANSMTCVMTALACPFSSNSMALSQFIQFNVMPARQSVPQFETVKPQRPYQGERHSPSVHTKIVHHPLIYLAPGSKEPGAAFLAVLRDEYVIRVRRRSLVERPLYGLKRDKDPRGIVALNPITPAFRLPFHTRQTSIRFRPRHRWYAPPV